MTTSGLREIAKSKGGRLVLLAAIVVTGFALRVVNIDQWPLWGDEALTILKAHWPVAPLFMSPIDPTPGLYYALHKALLGPMVDAAEARYLSLLFGTLTIPAAYWLAREARIPALLTAALVALSFPLIDYSQEARAYALLVLLVTCSAASFIRWTRSKSLAPLLLALLFGLLSFYTHLISLFWVGPLCLAILWIGRRQAILPLLLFGLLAIPELARLAVFKSGNFSWQAQASIIEAGNTLSRAMFPFRPTGLWAAGIALIIVWRFWDHRSQIVSWAKANPAAAYALAAILVAPLFIWLAGSVASPIFMTRAILIAVPAFILALSLLLGFEHRFGRFGVVSLYAGSLLVTGTTREKDDWRMIAERVGGDAILMCQPWQAAAMRHALGRDNPMFLRYDDGLRKAWGDPWPAAYFRITLSKEWIEESRHRGDATDRALFPVWPVRSGQIEQMATKPVSLGQATAYCDSVRTIDREPRYIAE